MRQRLSDDTFLRQRYLERPRRGHEIRIPVRTNGHATQFPNGRRADETRRRVVANSDAERTASPSATTRGDSNQLQKLEAELAEWKEKYSRLLAEQENNRKRLQRNYANQAEQETEGVLRDMLPLADNLERALSHAVDQEASLKEGVALTLKAFTSKLAKYGVEPIEAEGQPFDPNLHEAVGITPVPGVPAGTIVRVEETGYTFRGKLLRPARVWVAAEGTDIY